LLRPHQFDAVRSIHSETRNKSWSKLLLLDPPPEPGIWKDDFLASVVIFLVALPLCMGIAIASGLPPAAGLLTGIVGGIVVGVLGGSPLQVSGPAAGLAVIVWDLVETHGPAMLGVIILLAGLMQTIAGLARLGQ
jgi:MFS superfamily sulfate permease-like transporter